MQIGIYDDGEGEFEAIYLGDNLKVICGFGTTKDEAISELKRKAQSIIDEMQGVINSTETYNCDSYGQSI